MIKINFKEKASFLFRLYLAFSLLVSISFVAIETTFIRIFLFFITLSLPWISLLLVTKFKNFAVFNESIYRNKKPDLSYCVIIPFLFLYVPAIRLNNSEFGIFWIGIVLIMVLFFVLIFF